MHICRQMFKMFTISLHRLLRMTNPFVFYTWSHLLFSINERQISSTSNPSWNLKVTARLGKGVSYLRLQHRGALGNIFLFLQTHFQCSNIRYDPDILNPYFFTHTIPGAIIRHQ